MPSPSDKLAGRYDAGVIDLRGRPARVRLDVTDGEASDAVLENGSMRLEPPSGDPDALLRADSATWERIARDVRGGMDAYRAGKLQVRHNLHLGVGFLAATSAVDEERRLRFETVRAGKYDISTLSAGAGPPVVCLHGLGGTKASFLPTVSALADDYRVTAIDLPGFGESDKPFGAPYDARFFATTVVKLLDALGLERAYLIGNSMGGRVALEVGLRHSERVERLALLAPSLAWRSKRPWAPLLRLVRPELGVIQPTPRAVVDAVLNRALPDADGWAAAGVDEFKRAFMTPSGRAAFYAAARQIYLEEPEGENGFWPRLKGMEPESLWVWGKRDTVVPIAFARHVADTLPNAKSVELDCGHVPQVESPGPAHRAIAKFFGAN